MYMYFKYRIYYKSIILKQEPKLKKIELPMVKNKYNCVKHKTKITKL